MYRGLLLSEQTNLGDGAIETDLVENYERKLNFNKQRGQRVELN